MTCGMTAMVTEGTADGVRLDATEVGWGGIGLLAVQPAIAMISAVAIAMVTKKRAADVAWCSEFLWRAGNFLTALTLRCRVRAIRRADCARDRFRSLRGLLGGVSFHIRALSPDQAAHRARSDKL